MYPQEPTGYTNCIYTCLVFASAVSFSLVRIAQSLTLGLAKLTGAFQVSLNGSS